MNNNSTINRRERKQNTSFSISFPGVRDVSLRSQNLESQNKPKQIFKNESKVCSLTKTEIRIIENYAEKSSKYLEINNTCTCKKLKS